MKNWIANEWEKRNEKRWLKIIKQYRTKYNKLKNKLERQQNLLNLALVIYDETFDKNLWESSDFDDIRDREYIKRFLEIVNKPTNKED